MGWVLLCEEEEVWLLGLIRFDVHVMDGYVKEVAVGNLFEDHGDGVSGVSGELETENARYITVCVFRGANPRNAGES